MTVFINSQTSKEELNEALAKLRPIKRFDAKKYAGKIKWDEDPLEFQRRLRNEWE